MVEVGVKQLKRELSAQLRRVAHGERVRVTHRGRPVADLVPVGESVESPLEQLIAAGRVSPPSVRRRPEPPPLVEGPSASAEILAERAEDR